MIMIIDIIIIIIIIKTITTIIWRLRRPCAGSPGTRR